MRALAANRIQILQRRWLQNQQLEDHHQQEQIVLEQQI